MPNLKASLLRVCNNQTTAAMGVGQISDRIWLDCFRPKSRLGLPSYAFIVATTSFKWPYLVAATCVAAVGTLPATGAYRAIFRILSYPLIPALLIVGLMLLNLCLYPATRLTAHPSTGPDAMIVASKASAGGKRPLFRAALGRRFYKSGAWLVASECATDRLFVDCLALPSVALGSRSTDSPAKCFIRQLLPYYALHLTGLHCTECFWTRHIRGEYCGVRVMSAG